MKFHLTLGLAALLLAAIISGCADEAPPGPSLGSASISKYVAIGNSLTAGYQSNALYASAQQYSFPNLIAQQLTSAGAPLGSFEQPLYGDPGNADPVTGKAARYEIIVLDPVAPVIGPRGLTAGAPTNSTLPRPYDNLGLPGAPLAGFMDTVGTYHGSFGPLVVRSAGGFPKSPHLQTLALNPDLVTFWLGANDVLGYATTGGASPTITAPTPSATFQFLYAQALSSLRASLPNAKIVVGNIPSVTAVPFFTTIGPKIRANLGFLFDLGAQLYYQTSSGIDSTRLNESSGMPMVTLVGGAYAGLIGQATFRPYASLGLTYPQAQALFGIDSTKQFGLDSQNPIPNAYVLDAAEQTIVANAISDFNSTIATVAAANNAHVVDAHGFFNGVAARGFLWAGSMLTTDYVTGGLFSLDGVHPSSRGYGVVANEFIKVINQKFGTSIQPVNISSIPGLPAPAAKTGADGYPSLPPDALRSYEKLFAPSTLQ